jgi:hypothetical protein
MIDKFLKASSEAAAIAALSPLGCRGTDINGKAIWLTNGPGWALDAFGSSPGLVGFHLNMRLLDDTLAPAVDATGLVIATPTSPYRVWA